MTRICCPVFEIAPFTGGGIGTWIANTLDAYRGADLRFEILFYGRQNISATEFAAVYPGVIFHTVDIDDPGSGVVLPGQPAHGQGMASAKMWTSYVLMRKLEQLERDTGPFDVIEFIDWSGPGYCTMQQKALGRLFQSTDLVVRLHGTDGVLRCYEPRPWSYENLVVSDLEHEAILRADYCVSHLSTVARHFQSHYRLSDEWFDRCVIELPPVKSPASAKSTIVPALGTHICFTSKFQGVKRPTIFTQGVAELIRSEQRFSGNAVFAAFVSDELEAAAIREIIPDDAKQRFIFMTEGTSAARDKVIAAGIAVFSGVFETFCFAAYEASLMGAVVVLNSANPAFGDGTPWVEGVNCLKYDGTVSGLAATLRRIIPDQGDELGSHGLSPIVYNHAKVPYWGRVSKVSTPTVRGGVVPLSVIIPNHGGGTDLLHQIADVIRQSRIKCEIVVADKGSTDPVTAKALELIESSQGPENEHEGKVLRRAHNATYSALMNAGIAAATHDIVAILPLHQRDTSGFLSDAAAAISRGACDVVLPSIRVLEWADDLDIRSFWFPVGGSRRSSFVSNRLGFGALVTRRDLLTQQRFDECLEREWTWDVLLRLAYAGASMTIDVDRGINVTQEDLDHWGAWDEYPRRRHVEAIRRNAWQMQGRRHDFPWNCIGDLEITSAEWYIARDELGYTRWEREKTREFRDRLASLSNESVRHATYQLMGTIKRKLWRR